MELYINYNTLYIPKLHKFQLLLLVHKCIHHKQLLPRIYHDYFHYNQNTYIYGTGNKTCLHFFGINGSFGQR